MKMGVQKEKESIRKRRLYVQARLDVKGYSQKKRVNYDKVFSPIVRHTSIRILLSMTAQFDVELDQSDVKTILLHGDLKEQIYIEQPKGFKELEKTNYVCELKKSLYGKAITKTIVYML